MSEDLRTALKAPKKTIAKVDEKPEEKHEEAKAADQELSTSKQIAEMIDRSESFAGRFSEARTMRRELYLEFVKAGAVVDEAWKKANDYSNYFHHKELELLRQEQKNHNE